MAGRTSGAEHVRHVLAFFGAAAPEDAVAEASVQDRTVHPLRQAEAFTGVLEAIPALQAPDIVSA